jgi:hypothetical protein
MVGVDMASIGVGSAPKDAQSKGLQMVYVSLGVRVQLCKWWRMLGIRRRPKRLRESACRRWRRPLKVGVDEVEAAR